MTLDQIEGLKVWPCSSKGLLSCQPIIQIDPVSDTAVILTDGGGRSCLLQDPLVQCWTTEDEDDGDPPRLWAPDAMYPGTAFTRSLGDAGTLSHFHDMYLIPVVGCASHQAAQIECEQHGCQG